jgi:low affinity Fe/Cu permease
MRSFSMQNIYNFHQAAIENKFDRIIVDGSEIPSQSLKVSKLPPNHTWETIGLSRSVL